MDIFYDKHLNMECVVLEKGKLRIKIIPELGFKIASIAYDKAEMLFQPSEGRYGKVPYGSDFESSDTSGMDEMIPTIDKGVVGDYELKDHGDVWSVPWEAEVLNGSIEGCVKLKSLPLEFRKTVSILDDDRIEMEYCVKNLSDKTVPFLWALHGLNVIGKGTMIQLPEGMKKIFDVNRKMYEDVDDGIIEIDGLKDGGAYKYYVCAQHEECSCSLIYHDKDIRYSIEYSGSVNPYLGIWITKGGFKGEYNCALEPSNGFYDGLDRAIKNDKYGSVGPFDEKRWNIIIRLGKIRD